MSSAEQKAHALLLSHLTEEQKIDLHKRDRFDVVGRSGRRYRIKVSHYTSRNIQELRKGAPVFDYCAWPRTRGWPDLPHWDKILAQKLLLETNDFTFRLLACSYRRLGAPWWRLEGNPIGNALLTSLILLGATFATSAVTLLLYVLIVK